MKKILFFILFSSYSLTAYTLFEGTPSDYVQSANSLPNSISSTVKKVNSDTITLTKNVPAGMSGIIVHNYGNGLSAITHATISLGNGQASVKPYTAIAHKNIPSIQTAVTNGDKVIFGNFYNNALLIAPDQITYQQITKTFKRTWIHPDAYALHFMKEGETELSLDSLERFAQDNQIGLVLAVAQGQLLVIDPISKKVIQSTPIQTNSNAPITPFYARFEQMNLSIFNLSERTYTPYFQSVAGL